MSDYTNLLKEMLEALKEFFSYTHQDAQKVADVINKTLDDIAEAKGINREELYDCVTRQAQNAKEGDARNGDKSETSYHRNNTIRKYYRWLESAA